MRSIRGTRFGLRGALAFAFLLTVAHAPGALAGACQDQDRLYCVVGNSTGSDWTWSVDSFSAMVVASVEGLIANDPPGDIVSVMVSSMINAGATATVHPTNATCFIVTSCHRIVIDGTVVTTTAVSFNPDIYQAVPEPSSLAMIAAGVLGLGVLNRRRLRIETRDAKTRSATA